MQSTEMELNKVGELFKVISDQGNIVISKFITYFGVSVGLGGGTAQVIASNSTAQAVQEVVEICAAASPTWLSYAPFIAAVSLALKHIADIIFRRIEHKHRLKDGE